MILGGFVLATQNIEAQNRTNSNNRNNNINNNELRRGGLKITDRMFVGGNVGASLGNTATSFVEISPLLGYKITEKFAAGAGITYQFFGQRQNNYKATVLGWRTLARYDIWKNALFAQTEYEVLNYRENGGDPFRIRRWPIGGGYRQNIGGRSAITAILMRDLLWDENASPYGSPWITRIGVNVGF